ncbi:enoyl-CoA hydratase/isomerase family protein [Ornithinimicrobium cryptoxanthini]|uniref:3-hydroxyisobutyryl-CoA hydrolase n=1 Tax=Ornithinimicrobium cryptoxanthini TaxID=2934161 RepID=A0ABY4YIL3_9MICO|nr:3-hydroxyisobutyryl-CoA hydrolase [Ornithinimicrobium cryptoxanthini]USQ76472.1 enoyl-CoA hydratase/isomerase family protein [Ornithinimicrobium cryptoxanthini]
MTAPEPTFAPAPGRTADVEYAGTHRIGRVRLNRPRALNSLTGKMVESMLAQLTAWATDDAVGAVFIDGAGEKGLCAGGDVRAVREAVLSGETEEAIRFWDTEYRLNALIADYPKPYVAWMDGVVMGGGVGISAHGSQRLVTERAKVAMPETIIGFYPDVGGLYHLAHAPGELGTHAALTGFTFGPADAVVLGLADGVVAVSDKEKVLADLAAALGEVAPGSDDTATADEDDANATADADDVAAEEAQVAPRSELETQRGWIDECYAGDDATEILRRLLAHDDTAARAAGEAIASRSPHSVAATLAALRRAANLDVRGVLAQDARLSRVFVEHPDFNEGVRALLVDKDNAPQWADASIADVDLTQVLAALAERSASQNTGGPA